MLDNINWDDTGMLDGLTPEQYKVIKDYLTQINLNDLEDNEIAEQLICPVIRHIVINIMDHGREHSDISIIHDYITKPFYKEYNVTVERLLAEIDLNDLSRRLLIYCREFIPLGEKYLFYLDGQAELTVLFCRNYLMRLLNKVAHYGKT